MSTQILDQIPELDIEEELRGDQFNHAIPFCNEHKSGAFFPVAGTIVEAICGKLIRIRQFISHNRTKSSCPKCASFQGKKFNCYYCGKEVIG